MKRLLACSSLCKVKLGVVCREGGGYREGYRGGPEGGGGGFGRGGGGGGDKASCYSQCIEFSSVTAHLVYAL